MIRPIIRTFVSFQQALQPIHALSPKPFIKRYPFLHFAQSIGIQMIPGFPSYLAIGYQTRFFQDSEMLSHPRATHAELGGHLVKRQLVNLCKRIQ